MTDKWEFYPARVNNEPASIYVNLSYRARCPLIDAADLAWLRIYLLQPHDDGLFSQDEFEALCSIEVAVLNQLSQGNVVAHYVGRNTSGGCRDFYFYTDDGHNAQLLLSRAMTQFNDYEFDVGYRDEPDWSSYCDFLFPSPRNMQLIENKNVIETLEELKDQLHVSRNVMHWAYFPTPSTRNQFVTILSDRGFSLHSLIDLDAADGKYGVVVSCNHAVDYHAINDVTLMLYDISIELGGKYNGWETAVIVGSQNNSPPK